MVSGYGTVIVHDSEVDSRNSVAQMARSHRLLLLLIVLVIRFHAFQFCLPATRLNEPFTSSFTFSAPPSPEANLIS